MKKFLFLVLFIAGQSTFSQSQKVVVDNDIQKEEIEISAALKQPEPIVEYGDNNTVSIYETLRIRKSNNQDHSIIQTESTSTSYYGTLKIDDDGSGFSHNDPNHNPHTWWQPNGQDLNADVDWYVVVPGYLQKRYGIKPGDRVEVTLYLSHLDLIPCGEPCDASDAQGTEFLDWYSLIYSANVGDIGPDDKGVGEVSVKVAKSMGFDISDVEGIGPISTWNGKDCAPVIKITYYPSEN